MKLLVTGGAGFIGSNFILYWAKTHPDDYIVNLDKLTYAGNLDNLKEIVGSKNYKFVKGDILDSRLLAKTMKGIDIVVHFAAESHVDRSIVSPADFVMTNIVGTHTLLEAALKFDIKRFHHISTDEVFGSLDLNTSRKFNESTPYQPRSPYAASKASADHLVRAYHETYRLPITISNCSNNFGPYQYPEKLISLTITNLLEGKKVPVYGDGLYIRDWLYVEDHVRAIECILNYGKIGETYCIGGLTDTLNNIEIVKKILKIMNKSDQMIEFVANRPGHDRRYAIDWSKIKRELGWQPQYDFDTHLEKTVSWYKKHEKWWTHLKKDHNQKSYGS